MTFISIPKQTTEQNIIKINAMFVVNIHQGSIASKVMSKLPHLYFYGLHVTADWDPPYLVDPVACGVYVNLFTNTSCPDKTCSTSIQNVHHYLIINPQKCHKCPFRTWDESVSQYQKFCEVM